MEERISSILKTTVENWEAISASILSGESRDAVVKELCDRFSWSVDEVAFALRADLFRLLNAHHK
jgi:hypothetical protein